MAEIALTPQQIIRNMLQRRPAGSAAGATSGDNPLRGLMEERDSRLDSFNASLDPYELDVGGKYLKDLTGYRIPIASDLGNAVNAYLHGIKMNEYRNEIGAPVLKGSFGALKALYNRIPKDTPESIKSETVPIDNPEMIKSLGKAYLNE